MSVPTVQVPHYIRGLTAAYGDLSSLRGASRVAISSVRFTHVGGPSASDPTGYERVRFYASLRASARYAALGVPQIVMNSADSHRVVGKAFGEHGAIVVPTPEGREGHATPYLDAARLVRLHGGTPGKPAAVLKAEGDKKLDGRGLAGIDERLDRGYDVIIADRGPHSMQSMTPMQQRTESLMDDLFPRLLGIPGDATCGLQVYAGGNGVNTLLAYEDVLGKLGNTWKYLLYVPVLARMRGLRVTSVPVDLRYDPEMVAAEMTPAVDFKRMEQLLVMLEGGQEVAQMFNLGGKDYAPLEEERSRLANGALAQLRTLASRA